MRKLTVLLMLLVVVSLAGDANITLGLNADAETSNTGYVAPLPDKSVLFDHSYDGTLYGGLDVCPPPHVG